MVVVREFATSPIVRAVNRVGYMLCAAGVVMLAACGGDDVDVAPTTTAVVVTTVPPVNETTTTVSSTEISKAVFAAMSDGSAEALASVIGVVTPGSPADIAVRHQITVAELRAIAEDEIAAMATTSTMVEVGSTTSTMTAPETTSMVVERCESTNTCTVYDTPVFDNEGGLRSFSVNGVPLEQAVIGPGPLSVVETVQARVVSAYRAPSGVTAVLVSVTAADEALTIFGFAAIHRPLTSADLQPVQTLGSWGADQIAAGQSGETLLVFPDTPLDGDVVLTVVTSSSIDLELELALITP
ncbi:MAG TPA: hypothetical protein DCY63_00305 [Acidimicrobiaceae bacterium]|nr:hypothetical protein [Acidimicrobiaceae bacterium]